MGSTAKIMNSTAKISSRTRSRTKSEATVQPFLQDANNLDLVGLILQQLLDSTEGHLFASVEVVRERTNGAGVVTKYMAHEAGGIFKGIQYDYYMCTHAVVQALSLVCRLWDEIVVASVHGGAKEILPPRALRTLKFKARTVDMTPCFGTFLRNLEDKFGGAILEVPDEGVLGVRVASPPPMYPPCAVQTPARLSMSPLTPQPPNYIPKPPRLPPGQRRTYGVHPELCRMRRRRRGGNALPAAAL